MEDSELDPFPVNRMVSYLDVFREVNDIIPLQVIITFLVVAANPGISMTKVSDVIGRSMSTTSRHLLDLGDLNRFRKPGYRLINVVKDPDDRRRNNYYVNGRGSQLIRKAMKKFQASTTVCKVWED